MMLPLSPFLLSIVLKGAVVLAIAALATWMLRGATASARHGVWAAAFAALLVLPVLEAAGPSWAVSILPASAEHHTVAVAPVAALAPAPPAPPVPPVPPAPPVFEVHAQTAGMDAVTAQMEAEMEAAAADFEREMEGFADEMARREIEMEALDAALASFDHPMPDAIAPVVVTRATGAARGGFFDAWSSPMRWVAGLWAVGALMVGLAWLSAFLSASRLVREATLETDPEWGVLAERARLLSGLSEPVRLLRSDRLDVPIAWGFGRPAVVLPASADEWTDDRREAVLLHEMAHLRRHDAWTQVVAQAALALHWPNPLAWLGYRRFLDAREQACDDAVIQGGARPSAYAEHLVGVARGLRRGHVSLAAVAPMARCTGFEDRIRSILDANRHRGRLGRPALGGTVALALLVIVPLAAFEPVERALEEATTNAPPPRPDVPMVADPDTLDEWEEIEEAVAEVRDTEQQIDRLEATLPALHADLARQQAELARWHATGFRGAASTFGVSKADWHRAFADMKVELSDLDLEGLRVDALEALADAEIDVNAQVRAAFASVDQKAAERAYAYAYRVSDDARREAQADLERARAEVERTQQAARVWTVPAPPTAPAPPAVTVRPAPRSDARVSPAPRSSDSVDWDAIDHARQAALRDASS